MRQATYIKGTSRISDVPSSDPIYLLLGRSNVGKSSLINSLTNRKALAHTSGTPGKTIALNYYLINESFYLVDAPGYGYARRSKSTQTEFIIMIEDILLNHPNIISPIVLIDFKVGPTKDDKDIIEFLRSLGFDPIIVATKKDKIPNTKQYSREKQLLNQLNYPSRFFAVSNLYKQNIDELREKLLEEVEKYEKN